MHLEQLGAQVCGECTRGPCLGTKSVHLLALCSRLASLLERAVFPPELSLETDNNNARLDG
eukprot:7990392-Alexandrium_andersonii.AAC.1